MRTYLFISLLFMLKLSLAQTVVSKEEMKLVLSKMHSAYNQYESYSMKVRHQSFAGHKSERPIETSTGSFIKSGSSYYSDILNVVSIQNASGKLSVSKDQKTIIVANKDEGAGKVLNKDYIDQVLNRTQKIEKNETGKNINYIIYVAGQREIESYEITINKNNFMTRFVMNYRDEKSWKNANGLEVKGKPKLVVSYSDIELNPEIDKSKFNFSEYLSVKDKKYYLQEKYSSYAFHDTRIKLK